MKGAKRHEKEERLDWEFDHRCFRAVKTHPMMGRENWRLGDAERNAQRFDQLTTGRIREYPISVSQVPMIKGSAGAFPNILEN